MPTGSASGGDSTGGAGGTVAGSGGGISGIGFGLVGEPGSGATAFKCVIATVLLRHQRGSGAWVRQKL
jgi:hypothetical protein